MESEKPEIVSILAAATVDSEKPRVSISAVRAADSFLLNRSLSSSFSSAGTVPIRAPLTIDEDDDDDCVTEEHNSASSEDSRGFDSRSDEYETELEDASIGGVRIHSVLEEELGGEIGEGSGFSGGSVIYRPFSGNIDEETSVNYSSLEEESENSDDVEGVSESEISEAETGSMKAKVVIPRAIVSLDDDEFDEILDSEEEGDMLLRVTKAPSDEEAEVEDRLLQFGDKGVVDEPECSDSSIGGIVSTEEEMVKVNYSDKFDDGLVSSGNIEELSLSGPPGGSNDFMMVKEENSIETGMELSQSFKQLNEKGSIHELEGSIHELETLMKPGDAERIEDNAVELADMGVSDTPGCSGFVTDEVFPKEEDMLQDESSDNELVYFETSLGVVPGGCNERTVECEINTFDSDRGLDEAFSQPVEQGVSQGRISKNGNNINDDNTFCEAAELLIPNEESVGSGSVDSEDEDAGNMIDEAKEHCENDCGAVTKLEEPAYEDETKIGLSFECFQLTPTLDSTTTRNLEVTGEVDVVVSGCGSSDQKAKQESENEEDQESNDIVRKLSLSDEDLASSLRSSLEMANGTVENGEKINKQVSSHPDGEQNQISLGIEDTRLLSVKDVERAMPQTSDYDIIKNETQIPRLIHNHTLMELDESKETGDRRNKLFETTLQNYLDSLYSNQSVDLISEKVKERVKKTKLLKEKLERIIRTGLCSEESTATEVTSKLSLPGKHPTSLGLDYMSKGTKTRLHEQEFPYDRDFSINVLVIGKTGVGKSATINSIFGETKSAVGAFGVATKSVKYVTGNVGGIRISILDTPGLLSPATEEQFNQEVLMSIKTNMRKFPVDVILYIDRLDDTPDICLLKTITSSLGSSIWQNAIIVLTHATSDVPDTFIAQRSSLMHQSIRQAVPELSCVGQSKMPAILLAENNSESTCRDWRLNLLILCCSIKIRSKAGQNTNVENVTLLCSFWNVLVNSGNTFHSHDDLEKKKRQLLDSYPKMIWDEQSQECLEQEPLLVENQEPEEVEETKRGLKEGAGLGRVRRTKRGRLGFQATKRFGIYVDTSNLHTGFCIGRGDHRKGEEEEGRILVRMRSSMSVLGLVPVVMSVFTYVYSGKNI